jgi:hypothetical protein
MEWSLTVALQAARQRTLSTVAGMQRLVRSRRRQENVSLRRRRGCERRARFRY